MIVKQAHCCESIFIQCRRESDFTETGVGGDEGLVVAGDRVCPHIRSKRPARYLVQRFRSFQAPVFHFREGGFKERNRTGQASQDPHPTYLVTNRFKGADQPV